MTATLDSGTLYEDVFTPLPEGLYSRVTDREYSQSFGLPIPSSLVPASSFKYWVAKDEAWREWRTLRRYLLRSGGKVVDSSLDIPWLGDMQLDVLGPWMAGRDKVHAHPTMVLILRNPEDREKARRKLKSYDNSEFRDLGFGWLVLPPASEWKRSPATRAQRAVDAFKLFKSSYRLGRAELLKNQTIYEVPGPETKRATKTIAVLSPTGSHYTLATLGGVIQVNNVIFGVTVSSAFESREKQFNVNTPTNSEVTGKAMPPESLYPTVSIEAEERRPKGRIKIATLDTGVSVQKDTRRARNMSMESSSPKSELMSAVPQQLEISPSRRTSRRPSPRPALRPSHIQSRATYTTGPKLGLVPERFMLDEVNGWALVKIEPPRSMHNIMDVPNGFGETFVPTEWSREMEPYADVWIMTGQGAVIAQGLPQMISPESIESDPGELWIFQTTKGKLVPEDCGSWVISASTNCLLGVVMEVDSDRAFVKPAHLIIREISDRLDETAYSGPIKLPSWTYSTPQTTESQTSLDLPLILKKEREEVQYRRREEPSGRFGSVLGSLRWQSSKRSKSGEYSAGIGKLIGKTGINILWELRDGPQYEWQKLVPQLNDVIGQTPTKSQYESSPAVMLHGFMMGKSEFEAFPTVIIGCSSKKYAEQLRKAIKRSGILDTSQFKVKSLEHPIVLNEKKATTQSDRHQDMLV